MGAVTAAVLGAAASVVSSNLQHKVYKDNQKLLNPYDKHSVIASKCDSCGSGEFRFKGIMQICSYCRMPKS